MKQFSIFLLMTLIVGFSSCVKDEKYCIANRGGGDLKVIIHPTYDGKPLSNLPEFADTVYIKYSSRDFPGTNVAKYDDKLWGKKGTTQVEMNRFNCGIYYFYVVGKDPVSGSRLTGGASMVTDQSSGVVNITVPVKAE